MTIINRKIKPHHTQELAILEMEMKWSKNVQKCIDLSKKYFQLSLLSYCHAWYILKGMNQLSRHAMFEGLSITRDCFRFRSYSCTSFKEKKGFMVILKTLFFRFFVPIFTETFLKSLNYCCVWDKHSFLNYWLATNITWTSSTFYTSEDVRLENNVLRSLRIDQSLLQCALFYSFHLKVPPSQNTPWTITVVSEKLICWDKTHWNCR